MFDIFKKISKNLRGDFSNENKKIKLLFLTCKQLKVDENIVEK